MSETRSAGRAAHLDPIATLGQMSAKVVLHYAGRGVLKLPLGRGQAKIEALRALLSKSGKATGSVTFVSALTSLPSFYAISVMPELWAGPSLTSSPGESPDGSCASPSCSSCPES